MNRIEKRERRLRLCHAYEDQYAEIKNDGFFGPAKQSVPMADISLNIW